MNDAKGRPLPGAREVYADIFDLPHFDPVRHPRMSLYNRAAQFAPFAALSGYDEMVDEEARLVDNRIELSEAELEDLNRRLNLLSEVLKSGRKPVVTVTWFIPDPLKAGGHYETITETVRKVDPVSGTLQLLRKTGAGGSWMEIRLADVLELHGEDLGSPVD